MHESLLHSRLTVDFSISMLIPNATTKKASYVMQESTDTKLPLTSHDVAAERLALLRDLVPDAFVEGVLDAEKLRYLLGQAAPSGPERYGLSWAGKAEALRAVQALSTATLRPMREQSVDFDITNNLIIEGDNLEVLKLLQKSYHRRVKMIYTINGHRFSFLNA